jgi:hypothetical protein
VASRTAISSAMNVKPCDTARYPPYRRYPSRMNENGPNGARTGYAITVEEVYDPFLVEVWLRLTTRAVPLSEIVEALGDGTHSHQMGDPVPPGNDPRFRWPHTMWVLARQGEDPLAEYVADVLSFAEAHSTALQDLRPRCDRLDIFCQVFAGDAHGRWELSQDLMRRAADADLALTFDLQCKTRTGGASDREHAPHRSPS